MQFYETAPSVRTTSDLQGHFPFSSLSEYGLNGHLAKVNSVRFQ